MTASVSRRGAAPPGVTSEERQRRARREGGASRAPRRRAGKHSEPEGRGAAWTDERGAPATSEEGRRCLKGAPQARRKHRVVVLAAIATAAAVALTSGCAVSAPARRASVRVSYYLSLGDSLSQGVQPDSAGASVPTRQGYADLLYAELRRGDPGLRLVKLGCSGETTHTMINGGICSYPGGSQLATAASFVHAHRGRVSLITID